MGHVNDFHEQLAWSQQATDEPFWTAVYKKAFPDMVGFVVQVGDVPAQHNGIDRHIILSNGATLRIDEKKRTRDYGDILLEYVSNDARGTPGWIEKPLLIDYLAYAFMPSRRVYLFPWLMLRRAWLAFRDRWIDQYPIVTARNPGYNTLSVAVPIHVLRSKVHAASIIELSPDELPDRTPEGRDVRARRGGGEPTGGEA